MLTRIQTPAPATRLLTVPSTLASTRSTSPPVAENGNLVIDGFARVLHFMASGIVYGMEGTWNRFLALSRTIGVEEDDLVIKHSQDWLVQHIKRIYHNLPWDYDMKYRV